MNTLHACLMLAGLLAAPGVKDRPFMEAQVNNHPLRLQIDTGAETLMVFSYAADRIGLSYQKPPQPADPNRLKPGHFMVYPSDLCQFKLDNREVRMRLAVCEVPPWVRSAGIDGVVGWPVLSRNIMHIDWGQKTLEPMPQVPDPAAQWQKLGVYAPPGMPVLALQVSESGASPQAVYIDTGSFGGVDVASALWKEIVAQHPGLATTIEGSYSPGVGYCVSPVCWLPVLKLGNLELHDVPVSEAPKGFQEWPAYLAQIGLYGLTRLELVVDGRQNHAYVRAKQDYSRKYDYNRAGVVFLPADSQSADLRANVLDGGPAYEAGLRNGDRLLSVEGRDVAGWRTDPNGWMSNTSTFEQPAGTKVRLTVRRDAQPMDVAIVLQELLPVEATPASRPEDQASQSSQKTP
jgi:hypothetical protein